jgi:hypothetical protein
MPCVFLGAINGRCKGGKENQDSGELEMRPEHRILLIEFHHPACHWYCDVCTRIPLAIVASRYECEAVQLAIPIPIPIPLPPLYGIASLECH